MTLKVLYLAHDLSDAAVRRRVVTLQAGGAAVTVAGFQRQDNLLTSENGVRSIVFGRTEDGRMGQRIAAVARARLSLARHLAGVERPSVIIARNLETLALAGSASSCFGGNVPIVYECLDIHRLLLDDGIKGRILRSAEGFFGRDAQLLLTSSPAFVENYFKPRSELNVPIMLLENKVLDLGAAPLSMNVAPRPPAANAPWRIGWFGAIRCRKSFAILSQFAQALDGKVEIVIRGRPSAREFPDFEARVRAAPHVSFHGAYRNPEDLSAIYSGVQFVWAIDFFEEGLNSSWLLPNRLYEGSLHGAIPIALSSTETGRFLSRRGLGLLLERPDAGDLRARFETMSHEVYRDLFNPLAATDRSQWVTDRSDCKALVRQLTQLATPSPARPDPAITSTLQSES